MRAARITLALLLLALAACANRPAPRDSIAGLSEAGLYAELWWLNRGSDSVFTEGTRADHIAAVRDEILRRRSDWPPETVAAIRAGRVELGMTMPQVATSIGLPIEYPWWETRRRPIGMDGDHLRWHSAMRRRNQWTYRVDGQHLKVWFRSGAVFRIMDDRTGRIETSD